MKEDMKEKRTVKKVGKSESSPNKDTKNKEIFKCYKT